MNTKLYQIFNETNEEQQEDTKKVTSLKTFYEKYPHFNYHYYRKMNETILNGFGEIDTIIYWYKNDRNFDFGSYENQLPYHKKDILIYPHTTFQENNGGIMVQYKISQILDSLGERVRILNFHDNNASNPIYNNFYENDFKLNNMVVVYCEDIEGNPFNGKYVVRWMLSELGKNVPYEKLYTWNKDELVYFFNYEERFFENDTIKKNDIYKFLTFFYNNENIKNNRYSERNGYCHTFRKMDCYHKNTKYIHSTNSREITRFHKFEDYIDIFNSCEYFVSYDPLTYLQIISILCGCICINYPIENVSKEDWYKKTAFYEFMIENGLQDIPGIAYGDGEIEIERARKTISLLKEQIIQINKWFLEKKIKSFILDINNWGNNNNLLKNIYTCDKIYENLNSYFQEVYPAFDPEFYSIFYSDLEIYNFNQSKLINHYHNYGKNEGRLFSVNQFYELYPDFNVYFYRIFNPTINNPYQLMSHYHNYGKKEEIIISEKQFQELYPEFNLDFYSEFHSDLKSHNFTQHIFMYHYHAYGKKEGRICSMNQFLEQFPDFHKKFLPEFNLNLTDLKFQPYQLMSYYSNDKKEQCIDIIFKNFQELYPDFDVEFYKKFNPDLSHFNNFQLMYHYHTIGFNTNKIYFTFDYDFISKEKDLTPELQDKIHNHSYFRKIKNYEELLEFHKTYKKKCFIYCKESFYKYYYDFDYEFYKNKYFLNTGSDSESEEKSEIEILLYYHLQGVSQNHVINNKIKFIMYTPPYENKCGGIIVMHYLCQLINQIDPNKYYAKLFMHNDFKYNNQFCTDFAKIDEINNNTVVIYPETIIGNPLNAKNVVRWILLELGIEMPIDHYKNFGENDHIYYWESKDLSDYKQLSCPWLNPIFYNKNVEKKNKQKTCYLIKKGRLIHKQFANYHPSDSICIDDLSSEEINVIFNECRYFYCYDPNSAYVIFSLICGCIPIIRPIEGVSENDYFKSRIFNFKGTIYNKGIVYGYDENKIQYILNEDLNEISNYYKNLFNMYIKTVKDFLEDMNNLHI